MSKGFDSRDLDQRYLDILAAARQHFGADRAPRERFHEWYEGKYGKKPDAQKAYLPPQIVKNGYLQVGDGSYWLDRSLMNKEPLSESGPGNSGEELERDATVEEELETAVNTAFSLERDLKRSLLSNLDQLVSGLKLYMRDGHTGQQFRTDDVGVIDILALGPLNELVIVELKAGRADDKAIAQILRYVGWASVITQNRPSMIT